MSGDYIETIDVAIEVQQNGIIREKDTGYIIGRLGDYEYEKLKDLTKFAVVEKSRLDALERLYEACADRGRNGGFDYRYREIADALAELGAMDE